MKASRSLTTALTFSLGLGLTTLATALTSAAWAQSEPSGLQTTTTTTTTTSNLPTPEQDSAMAPPPRPPAPPRPERRAHYDSRIDQTTYDDAAAPMPPPDRAAARSGTTSEPDEAPEVIPPRKEPTPRVHDMNRPTRLDDQSNTTAPALGTQTDAHAQGPTNGLMVDAGLGAGFGLDSSSVLWGVGGEYSFAFVDMPKRLAFKTLFDVNFAHGTDVSQFLSIGLGANWYLGDILGTETNRAFIDADVSLGDATNSDTAHSATSAVVGVGMGYTFLRTAQSDLDVLVHYAFLLNKLDNTLPSVLSFRVGASF